MSLENRAFKSVFPVLLASALVASCGRGGGEAVSSMEDPEISTVEVGDGLFYDVKVRISDKPFSLSEFEEGNPRAFKGFVTCIPVNGSQDTYDIVGSSLGNLRVKLDFRDYGGLLDAPKVGLSLTGENGADFYLAGFVVPGDSRPLSGRIHFSIDPENGSERTAQGELYTVH